ncbi:hypothetical protein Hypma_007577 [Hypsizygus marmoreus]|uniref:Uncharacterized protein n=1 Tax=Hypsizygus marmoreus TaxID=39966 RepID=A0A369JYB6_HYPMA|nr:hypothetical protein Hypma_007577 [Hypsizygus marmoreus]
MPISPTRETSVNTLAMTPAPLVNPYAPCSPFLPGFQIRASSSYSTWCIPMWKESIDHIINRHLSEISTSILDGGITMTSSIGLKVKGRLSTSPCSRREGLDWTAYSTYEAKYELLT